MRKPRTPSPLHHVGETRWRLGILRIEDHDGQQPARIFTSGVDDVAVVVAVEMASLHDARGGDVVLVHHRDQRFRGDRVFSACRRRQAGAQRPRDVALPVVGDQMRVRIEQRLGHVRPSYSAGDVSAIEGDRRAVPRMRRRATPRNTTTPSMSSGSPGRPSGT